MNLTHEYIHHRRGYRLGAGLCWIRVYRGEAGDAPVVICEEMPEVGGVGVAEISEYLAAEVIAEHFSDGLPEHPRPLLWIEHQPRRRGPDRYYLLTFPSYTPRALGAGFVRRVSLGTPEREPLTREEAEVLIRR